MSRNERWLTYLSFDRTKRIIEFLFYVLWGANDEDTCEHLSNQFTPYEVFMALWSFHLLLGFSKVVVKFSVGMKPIQIIDISVLVYKYYVRIVERVGSCN